MSFSLIACDEIDLAIEENIENEIIKEDTAVKEDIDMSEKAEDINEDGHYTSKEDLALYIHTYGKLPGNFISKKEARDLGWEASKGNLWDVSDEMSIGGDKFGNREKLLPIKDGRQYYECDVAYSGGYRGAERIVYSNDGLIYYTEDHYESFILLYGDELL